MHEQIEIPLHKQIRRRIGWSSDHDFDAASMEYVYRVILLRTAILRNPPLPGIGQRLLEIQVSLMRLQQLLRDPVCSWQRLQHEAYIIANQEFLFGRGRR